MLHEKITPYPVSGYLREAVDDALSHAISRVEPRELRETLCDATTGGKRVRPLVTMLACGSVGGAMEDALPAAAAIEMLHASSLVHDDIMDFAELRRGAPSIHHRHGTSMAILAGDTLIALAFRLMQDLRAGNKERILSRFTGTFLHLCEGQGYDLALSDGNTVTVPLHRRMVEKKTALLLESAAAIGAMVGTTNEDHIQALARFGFALGMAFQAKDDWLDLHGKERHLGKPVGADRRNGKLTFLTVVSAGGHGPAGLPLPGAVDHAQEYTRAACSDLETLPPTPAREHLRTLAESLLDRDA